MISKYKFKSLFLYKIEAIMFSILQISCHALENVNEQLSVCFVRCFHLIVVWYYFMKKKIFLSSLKIIKHSHIFD